jgi:hypothetical protein
MFIDTFHRVRAVEQAFRERHGDGIADAHVDPTVEAQPPGQVTRDVAELRREIDPAHPAAEAVSDIARRATDAAADVQDVVGGADVHQAGHLLGGFDAAAVELVVGASASIVGRSGSTPSALSAASRRASRSPRL